MLDGLPGIGTRAVRLTERLCGWCSTGAASSSIRRCALRGYASTPIDLASARPRQESCSSGDPSRGRPISPPGTSRPPPRSSQSCSTSPTGRRHSDGNPLGDRDEDRRSRASQMAHPRRGRAASRMGQQRHPSASRSGSVERRAPDDRRSRGILAPATGRGTTRLQATRTADLRTSRRLDTG